MSLFANGVLHTLIPFTVDVLILAMLIRAVASWFQMDERIAFIRFLARMTNPFIDPIRRFVPPVGFLDLSFLVAWFLLVTIQILLVQALPIGW